MFNIVLDEQKKGDLEVKFDAITFLVEEQLVNDYNGFVILSDSENNGKGLSLKPNLESEGGCSTCSSCH